MAKIKWSGREDARVLDADDLAKADVAGFRKTTFAKGEAVEVSEDVARALIEDEELFGFFEEVEEAETAAPAKKSAKKSDDSAAGEAATISDAPSKGVANGASTN